MDILYTLPFILTILLLPGWAVLLFRREQEESLKIYFFLFVLSIWLWNLGGLIYGPDNEDPSYYGMRLMVFGLVIIPAAFLYLILELTRDDKIPFVSIIVPLASLFLFFVSPPSFEGNSIYWMRVFFTFFILVFGVALYILSRRYSRKNSGVLGDRKGYLLWGGLITLVVMISADLFPRQSTYSLASLAIFCYASLMGYYLATAYRLIDPKRVIKKVMVETVVGGVVVGIFLLSTVGLGKLSIFPVFLAAMLVAVIFQPLSEYTEKVVDYLLDINKISRRDIVERITQDIASLRDRDSILPSIIKKVIEVMDIRKVSLILLDEKKKEYFMSISAGLEKSNYRFKADDLLPTWMLQEKRMLLKEEVIENPRFRKIRKEMLEKLEQLEASACLSFFSKDNLLGMLTLGEDGRCLSSSEDLTILNILSDEIAVILENLYLYENRKENFITSILSLAAAIEAKDVYTRGHCERVASYAEIIATRLGLSSPEIEAVKKGGFLHDVGKVGIADVILLKPGKLTQEEFEVIKKHPVIGSRIVEPLNLPNHTYNGIKYHHEKINGSGYPEGLSGDEIPLAARIMAIVDTYEAMTSNRPYREAKTREEAISELNIFAGSWFDPEIVEIFITLEQKSVISDQWSVTGNR